MEFDGENVGDRSESGIGGGRDCPAQVAVVLVDHARLHRTACIRRRENRHWS